MKLLYIKEKKIKKDKNLKGSNKNSQASENTEC